MKGDCIKGKYILDDKAAVELQKTFYYFIGMVFGLFFVFLKNCFSGLWVSSVVECLPKYAKAKIYLFFRACTGI